MDQQQPVLVLEKHQHHKITKLVFALSEEWSGGPARRKALCKGLKSDAAAAGGEAGIFEQLPMGLLMVEKQEPAGTCPRIQLTPNDDFCPP
jgi:hypothetical protein